MTNIVKNYLGKRYSLTSRRLTELDLHSARLGGPWYARNKDIRQAAKEMHYGVDGYITVWSINRGGLISPTNVTVGFGKAKTTRFLSPEREGLYHIGCAYFDFKTFKRILRNAGVKGTQKKSFAAQAGA